MPLTRKPWSLRDSVDNTTNKHLLHLVFGFFFFFIYVLVDCKVCTPVTVPDREMSTFLFKTSNDGDSTVFPSKLVNTSEVHALVSLCCCVPTSSLLLQARETWLAHLLLVVKASCITDHSLLFPSWLLKCSVQNRTYLAKSLSILGKA